MNCSFCGRQDSQDYPLLRSQIKENTFICFDCIMILGNSLEESNHNLENLDVKELNFKVPKPSEIKQNLDEYIIGQEEVKKKVVRCCL